MNSTQVRRVAILPLLLLIVFSISGGTAISAPHPPGSNTSDQTSLTTITAIDVYSTVLPIIGAAYPHLVNVNDLTDISRVQGWTLSPDGNTLLIILRESKGDRNYHTCLYTLVDQGVICRLYESSVRHRTFAEGLLVWSPDGNQIVMSEDWPRYLDDPDLVVFDLASGTDVNLTDDGFDTITFSGDEAYSISIDYAPFWASDSQSIYFFRITQFNEDSWNPQLMNISIQGGEPSLVADLSGVVDAQTFFYPLHVAVSPDGQRAVIISNAFNDSNIGVNIWSLDLTTGIAEILVANETIYRAVVPTWSEDPRLFGRDVVWSVDGDYVVIALDYATRSDYGMEYSDLLPLNYLIVDTLSGEVRPLVDISQFPDQETYNTLGGYFKFSPILGLVTPDHQLVYATIENTLTDPLPVTFWSVPFTLDVAPVQLSTVDMALGMFLRGNDLTDRVLGSVAPNGTVMVQSSTRPETQSGYVLQFSQ